MLRLARAVIGAGAGGRRSAASMAGCTLWVDPADLPREDAAAASRRAELDAARAAVLGADVAALLSDPCGVYTVVEAGSGPEVALGLRPEQLPPGLQGPTSRAKDRGGSATLAVPVRGMTPTLSGLRKLAHGEPAFKAGASWIHSAAAGGVDTVTGLPSTVVPPAERHARDPEDTVYGELNEPERLADPRPGGRDVEAYLEAEGVVPRAGVPGPGGSGAAAGGGRSRAEAAAAPLLGSLTSMYLHKSSSSSSSLGSDGQPTVAWAPPPERQTVVAAAAAASGPYPAPVGALKLPQAPAAEGAVGSASGAAVATQAQPAAWAHEVDTDLEFGQ